MNDGETYQYVFSPLVNVSLSEERHEVGPFSARKVSGDTLEHLWRWMQHSSGGACNPRLYAEAPAEASFVVKDHSVVVKEAPGIEENEPSEGVDDLPLIRWRDHDVFRKERMCLNLCFNEAISTPIVFCADEFPIVHQGMEFWSSPDAREDWTPGGANGGQQITDAAASAIRDLMVLQADEFLVKRQWLKRALHIYDNASCLEREPDDQFRDYWETLEALFTDRSMEGMKDKLAQRIAMVLTHTDEGYTQTSNRLKELYNMRSKKTHGAHPIKDENAYKEVAAELRRCVRQSILMALKLSKSADSNSKWESRCKKLLDVRDRGQIEELKHIRDRWSAVW